MTRVLLTGAGGFAGHHFLEHVLRTTDWTVAITDSFRHKGRTDRVAQVLWSGSYAFRSSPRRQPDWLDRTTVITHDLTAPFSFTAADRIDGPGLDYIVAMASESHVDRSIADPVPFVLNNTAVMLHTLELARQLHPRAVVVVSTDEVYGPEAGGPHPEWDVILPSNPYSASKAAQEAIAISYWRTYGVPVVLINSVNLIGERQDAEKYVPMIIRKAIRGEVVTVHGSPGHIGSRYYLHCRNLADGIMFLLGRQPAMFSARDHRGADRPDRYNITGPDRISNLELAQMIATDAGYPLKYRFTDFHSARPGHDPHYGLDGGKLAVLGWKPPVPFAESLERTVRWTLDHREWLD